MQLELFSKECQYYLFSHADKACKCALSVLTALFRYGVTETYAARTPQFALVNTLRLLRQTYPPIPVLQQTTHQLRKNWLLEHRMTSAISSRGDKTLKLGKRVENG